VTRNKIPAAYGAVMGVLLFVTSVLIAYACLKLYDEPVREWLTRRFLAKGRTEWKSSSQQLGVIRH
jgi:peptidoglycan/LPS O-acetylase OafA/YrhL